MYHFQVEGQGHTVHSNFGGRGGGTPVDNWSTDF